MHPFYLPNPASVVSDQPADGTHQLADCIEPEFLYVRLPPIHQVKPEQRSDCSSSVFNYESDVSKSSSVSSVVPSRFSSFHPVSPTSSAPKTSTLYSGGKGSKKKRDDRKKYSKQASTGTTPSKVRKTDSEAGNRYGQALDQAKIVEVLKEGNPRLEMTAAPRNGGKHGWTPLRENNINWDVLKGDGFQPSLWNKACVNGSAILMIKHSNALLDDAISFLKCSSEQGKSTSPEESMQFSEALAAARNDRGEADWVPASPRIVKLSYTSR